MLKNKPPLLSASIAIFCIFYGDWGKMYYYETIKEFTNVSYYLNLNVFISTGAYLLLAFLSDIWCRKKMLYLSTLMLISSGFFLRFHHPMLSTIAISIAPVTPIAIAAYCDVHMSNDREPNVINTFMIRPLPWMLFPLVYQDIKLFFLTDIALGILVAIFTIWLFVDYRDKDNKKFSFGILDAVKVYGLRVCIAISIAFFFTNWAWSMLFYYLEKVENGSVVATNFMLSPGICFFLGAAFSRVLIRKKRIFTTYFEEKSSQIFKATYLKLIIYISIGIIPFVIFISLLISILNGDHSNVVLNSLPLFTFLGGVFIPSIYAFFGSQLKYHSLGLVYAALEVVQSVSEFTGAEVGTLPFFKEELNHIVTFAIFLSLLSLVVLNTLPKDTSPKKLLSQGNN